MFRGWLAIVFVSGSLVVADVVQRLFVAPWVRLRPSARIPVLGGWMKIMAWVVTRPFSFIAGCTIPKPPRIVPTQPGILVLMNHQSLFDIPLVIQTVADGYPRIVTRERYASRWIPVISQMIGLYQYPVVDPSANREIIDQQLDELAVAAATTDVPLVVFPEGSRTRDGEVGRFRRRGLAKVLAARPWKVYVFVADGFWKARRFKDFVRNLRRVDGRMEHVATLDWTDPQADPGAFIEEARERMVEHLARMRGGAGVA